MTLTKLLMRPNIILTDVRVLSPESFRNIFYEGRNVERDSSL